MQQDSGSESCKLILDLEGEDRTMEIDIQVWEERLERQTKCPVGQGLPTREADVQPLGSYLTAAPLISLAATAAVVTRLSLSIASCCCLRGWDTVLGEPMAQQGSKGGSRGPWLVLVRP